MVQLVKHDLEFILKQIKIAEAHSAAIEGISGENSIGDIGDELRELIDNPLLPNGLRTVDGSFNNLVPGREMWGASGQPFPQITQPNWVNENDDALMFGTEANPVWLNNNDYGPGSTTGSPMLPNGTVVDADPRLISNLIVDQTLDNPAVIAAALRLSGQPEANFGTIIPQIQAAHANVKSGVEGAQAVLDGLLGQYGVEMDGNTVLLRNVSPDEGLSAPFNSWFTLFGQFFDHGLDLVKKGGNGTVYIPLSPDDPLYNPASPHTNFMVLTRATLDENGNTQNVTTPWVDQNQTYTSHASHQVFLREYAMVDGKPVATGLLLEGANGGLATWKDIKDHAREMLGIELTDADVGMVPLLRTDPYGNFIPHPETGYAQVVVGIGADGIPNTADDIVVSGTPDAPASLANAVRLPNAFLDDIAHAAVPVLANGVLQQDTDDAVGYSGGFNSRGQQTSYDNELLDAHFITGDGRGNENIGLTAVHYVFHAEHNRQIAEIKATVEASGDAAFIAQWKLPDGSWDGERLFQAARFATEMQYQHLVFEEFARKVQPDIDVFMVQPDVELNPAIFAEFANVVYRFGHSMLNQTVDRTYADGTNGDIDLFTAFLNPLQFGGVQRDNEGNVILGADGQPIVLTQEQAAGAIALGMSAQHANEIDEFVTDVLRNQLVGIPLDLAALNIARGRDTGMPTLNQARAQFQEMANGDTLLRPYTSWADFALNLRNPESIINFIAAYGTHASVTSATTLQAKRDAAMLLVFGGEGAPADRLDFLNALGPYAAQRGGLDNVDLWIGGLAEKKMAFGGMLGSTFSFIFQLQMENLQDSDRFYYLSRAQGLNLLTELENNSLAKMVMRNTDLGENGMALPADIFSNPDHTLYMDHNKQMLFTGIDDPVHDNPVLEAISNLVERVDADGDGVAEYIRYNGLDHIVIQGTNDNDHIVSGGGDDAVWGGAGNDTIEAGYGVDNINGGAGDDIITSAGTDIGAVTVLKGESGNDVIVDGTGMSLIFGGSGQDYLVSGSDDGEIRGGLDSDFITGGDGANMLFGNEGDDWIEGGAGFDYIAGDNGELFFNSTIIGHDVLNGGQGDTDYDADSGDDIMFAGEGIEKNIGMWGHDWVTHQGQQTGADADMRVDIFTTLPNEVLRDRFSQVEALSGWHHNDVIRGDDRTGNGAEGGTTTDPTPETGFRYNELNQAGIDRIAGLGEIITPDLMVQGQYWANGSWEDGRTGTTEAIFVGGNILLGGGGSDTIEGRGGDDVIDGDRYLNVRVTGQSKDGIAFSVTSLEDSVTFGNTTKSLTAWMVEGRINPGSMLIVRELLSDSSGEDTAVYWDAFENYQITPNGRGGLTITHVTQTAGAIDPITGANRESDGTDTIYNIEWLQFGDRRVSTGQFLNEAPTGAPTIDDTTPTEGQTLTASPIGIVDPDGIASGFTYQWQMSADGGATWTNVYDNLQLTSDATFTPNNGILGFGSQIGNILRVSVSFTDSKGKLETVYSAPTSVVGDNWNAVPFLSNTFNGTAGDDIANGTSGLFGAGAADTLNGQGGNDILNGAGGNDVLNGGAGNDRLDGGAGTDTAVYAGGIGQFALGSSGSNLIVTDLTGAEGVDTLSTIETLRFAGTNYTVVQGTAGANANLNGANGAAGSQAVFGLAGNDTINGGAGNDLLIGGEGNDVVNGGAGNDTVYWTAGDGRDFIDGGADVDTVKVVGDATAETYRIYSREAWLGVAGNTAAQLRATTEIVITRNGTNNAAIIAELDNVEEIVINGMGGGDTFIPIGSFNGTSLFTSTITLEGTADDDTIDISALTSAHRVVFRSHGGNDTIIGTLRPQDVIELQPGRTEDEYEWEENEDGTTTITCGSHRVTFRCEEGARPTLCEVPAPVVPELPADPVDPDPVAPVDPVSPTTAGPAAPENFVITGTARSETLRGGDGDDRMDGGRGHDKLYGGAGNDHLLGGDGNDRLDGGAGNDRMEGGKGNDVYVVDSKGDRVVERANQGTDTVSSSVSYTLGAHVERLVLTGSADLNGTGNSLANVLKGNAGDNVLKGGGGHDSLFGGAGDDRLDGGMGNDRLFGGSGKDHLLGKSGDDRLYGGDGDDRLSGGSGDDRLVGGRGNDLLEGNSGRDVFVFERNGGRDTVTDFRSGVDRIDVKGLSNVDSLADLNVTRNGGDTVIKHGDDILVLKGVSPADLDQTDFIF